jgi:hypothetical protein
MTYNGVVVCPWTPQQGVSLAMPPPLTRPRTGFTRQLTCSGSPSASSSWVSLALNQTRWSPDTSTRASPTSHSSKRRGCCQGDNDVDGNAHVIAVSTDWDGRETLVNQLFYTLDNNGGIVTDHLGRATHQYLLELMIIHVRNVYNPSIYKDGLIK